LGRGRASGIATEGSGSSEGPFYHADDRGDDRRETGSLRRSAAFRTRSAILHLSQKRNVDLILTGQMQLGFNFIDKLLRSLLQLDC
jgi:hypothetical protein